MTKCFYSCLIRRSDLFKGIILIWLFGCLSFTPNLQAQNFTRLTIDNDFTWARGVSWIDFDNDGDLDLYVTNNDFSGAATFDASKNRNKLYRNDGDDTFVATFPLDMANDTSFSLGHSFADYDNDGYIDLYSASLNSFYETLLNTTADLGSELFRNEGPQDFPFRRIVSGDISSINRIAGFTAAWADYNNDGFVDLFITTPPGRFYPNETQTNVLFDNNGDGTFTRNINSSIVTGPVDTYTMPSWSDYDLDGDMDLFITAGKVQTGVQEPDYFFRNLLTETGSATFERDTTSSFAADERDGQQANWIDFDNDGDLDLYVTNFGGTPGVASGMANDLYRNDNGTYTKITTGAIVNDVKISLGQTWGDFDNDGDLDLYVTNLTSPTNFGGNNYYRNDGPPDYNFTRFVNGDFVSSSRAGWGAASGDYDNDGDLDMYVTINTLFAAAAQDALYRNDLTDGNSWFNVSCVGTTSNRSAIGARVKLKSTISGSPTWQLREISAHNASTGHNSLRAHFGLGDATTIDSLVVEWPSGIVDTFSNLTPDAFMTVTEGETITSINDSSPNQIHQFNLQQNYPNPFNPTTTIRFSLLSAQHVTLKVYDLQGKEVAGLLNQKLPMGEHSTVFDAGSLASGVYVYRLTANTTTQAMKAVLLR
ncbi:MAG: FG-GAP-like repeat-containing protein [Calditrichia bacterium]